MPRGSTKQAASAAGEGAAAALAIRRYIEPLASGMPTRPDDGVGRSRLMEPARSAWRTSTGRSQPGEESEDIAVKTTELETNPARVLARYGARRRRVRHAGHRRMQRR